MQTTNLVSTPNITGNIGSCEIKSDTFSKNSFYSTTVAVNSCTGEIVSQNTYYNYGYIYFPVIVIVTIVALRWLFDY